MGVYEIIAGSVLIVVCLLIIVFVIMQDSKQNGMSAMGAAPSDSYLNKNQGRTIDAKLVMITRVLAVIFFVLAIGVNLAIKFIK